MPELGVADPDDVARLKALPNTEVAFGAAVAAFVGVEPKGELAVPNGLPVDGKLPNTFVGLFANIVLGVVLATG